MAEPRRVRTQAELNDGGPWRESTSRVLLGGHLPLPQPRHRRPLTPNHRSETTMTDTTSTIVNGDVTGRIDPRAPHRAAGDALIERLRAMNELPAEMDGATEDRIREDAAVVAEAAVVVERARIRRSLSLPMLQALRVIPSGRIQQGCIITDGATVRERLRAAYFAVTVDPAAGTPAPEPSLTDREQPLDLVEVGRWLELCGSCDAGLPMSCTCPPGDIRAILARAVDEIVALREALA